MCACLCISLGHLVLVARQLQILGSVHCRSNTAGPRQGGVEQETASKGSCAVYCAKAGRSALTSNIYGVVERVVRVGSLVVHPVAVPVGLECLQVLVLLDLHMHST